MRNRTIATALLSLGAALALAACGDDGGADSPTSAVPGMEASGPAPEAGGAGKRGAGKVKADVAGIPPALAANRAEANELLPPGTLDAKLAKLEGHPVVVNQWASWCPPCRAEFPYFQAAAENYADRVAFLGVDMQDDRSAAEAFLVEFPVPYPSIEDPDASQIASLGGGIVSPTTVYIDPAGEVVEVFQGEYRSQEQLDTAIDELLAAS